MSKPDDLKTSSSPWQLDFETVFKGHPCVAASAQALLKANADPRELSRLLLWITLAAESVASFDLRAAAKAKRQAKKELYAQRERLRRIPARLRADADEVSELNHWPRLDPQLAVPGIPSYLANHFVSLPKILRCYAAYIEPRLVRDAPAKRHRFDDALRLAQVRLLDYIRAATKKPRYEALANLVTAALQMGGSQKVVSADELRDLKRHNPSLTSHLHSSWPRRRTLEKLAKKNPSLIPSLELYPHP